MGDSVDRKAATQAALEFIVEYLGGAFDEELQKKLMGRMNALPSAQLERITLTEEERRMYKKLRTRYKGRYADLLDRLVASAQEDADSAYTEGYTAAESKYRKMWDEMQATQPEQKVEELLPDGTLHLFTDADLSEVDRVWVSQNGTHYGNLYYADGEQEIGKWINNSPVTQKCNQCGFVIPDWECHRFKYCPNCKARMVQEGEPMADREMYCRDCDRSIYGKYHDCDVNIENGGRYVMADDKCYCKIVDGKRTEKYPWEKKAERRIDE